MARETKVGLLAGLAFIICFAVILANRGQHGPAPQAMSRYTLPSVTPPGESVVRPTVENAGRPPARQLPKNEFTSQRATADQQPTNLPRATRVSETRGDAGAAAEEAWIQAAHASARQLPDDIPPAEKSATANGTSLISSSMDAGSRQQVLERRLDELAADVASEGKATSVRIGEGKRPPVSQGPSPSPPPRGKDAVLRAARYTVKSGDTLSKIAAAHYDSGSPRFINAIFDANRSVLSSPDVLSIGAELVIPSIQGEQESRSAPPLPNTERKAPRSGPAEHPTADTGHKWYQIKKRDRYASIAREQLGDESRWPEIYELNRDKFPDPGLIREGVRIKLPVSAPASRTERTP